MDQNVKQFWLFWSLSLLAYRHKQHVAFDWLGMCIFSTKSKYAVSKAVGAWVILLLWYKWHVCVLDHALDGRHRVVGSQCTSIMDHIDKQPETKQSNAKIKVTQCHNRGTNDIMHIHRHCIEIRLMELKGADEHWQILILKKIQWIHWYNISGRTPVRCFFSRELPTLVLPSLICGRCFLTSLVIWAGWFLQCTCIWDGVLWGCVQVTSLICDSNLHVSSREKHPGILSVARRACPCRSQVPARRSPLEARMPEAQIRIHVVFLIRTLLSETKPEGPRCWFVAFFNWLVTF